MVPKFSQNPKLKLIQCCKVWSSHDPGLRSLMKEYGSAEVDRLSWRLRASGVLPSQPGALRLPLTKGINVVVS